MHFVKAHTGYLVGNKNGGRETILQMSRWKRNNMDIIRLYFGDGLDITCFKMASMKWRTEDLNVTKDLAYMGNYGYLSKLKKKKMNERRTGFGAGNQEFHFRHILSLRSLLHS